MSKQPKKKQPDWTRKTTDAVTVARIIRDVLDYKENLDRAALQMVAEAMAGTFDLTENEADQFIKIALVNQSDDDE
jgi:hypothetical protein